MGIFRAIRPERAEGGGPAPGIRTEAEKGCKKRKIFGKVFPNTPSSRLIVEAELQEQIAGANSLYEREVRIPLRNTECLWPCP